MEGAQISGGKGSSTNDSWRQKSLGYHLVLFAWSYV